MRIIKYLGLIFAVAAGLVLIARLTPHTDAHETDVTNANCAEDPSGNHFIDTQDISQLTGVFGQAGPPAQLDIAPELMPDGFVDVQDIVLVTAHFGEGCIGTTGADSVSQALSPSEVWDCTFKVSGFLWSASGNYILSHDWGGKTVCKSDGGQYITDCFFEWEYRDASGWHPIDVTMTSTMEGVFCIAQGDNAWLPLRTDLRGSIQHSIRRSNGTFAHPSMYHADNVIYTIP